RSDDAGESGLDDKLGRLDERLEAQKPQASDLHRGPCTRRMAPLSIADAAGSVRRPSRRGSRARQQRIDHRANVVHRELLLYELARNEEVGSAHDTELAP